MHGPEHLGHHEAAEALPLVTESAVVTEVAAMDRNRTGAVEDAVGRILVRNDADDWYRDAQGQDGEGPRSEHVDWDALVDRALGASRLTP